MKMILATGTNGELGYKNELLFHISEDMKLFKQKTIGATVVMGGNTYRSLPTYPKGLPARHNLVLTRSKDTLAGVEFFGSPGDMQAAISTCDNAWLIGGAEIYKQFEYLVDEIHWTRVNDEPSNCDTYYMPPCHNSDDWHLVSSTKLNDDAKIEVYKLNA